MSVILPLAVGWPSDSDSGDEPHVPSPPTRTADAVPRNGGYASVVRDGPAPTRWMIPMRAASSELFRQLKLWQRRPARIAEGMGGTGCLALGIQACYHLLQRRVYVYVITYALSRHEDRFSENVFNAVFEVQVHLQNFHTRFVSREFRGLFEYLRRVCTCIRQAQPDLAKLRLVVFRPQPLMPSCRS